MEIVKVLNDGNRNKAQKRNSKEVFQNLKEISNDASIISKNENVFESLVQLCDDYWYWSTNEKIDIINLSFEYEFPKIICNILNESYSDLERSLLKEKNEPKNNNALAITVMSIEIIQSFTNYSIKFISDLSEAGALTYLFKYLINKKLVNGYAELGVSQIIRPTIGSLHNMSKLYSNFSEKWKAQNA